MTRSVAPTAPICCAKGMQTRLPRKFEMAAAATIEVSRCLRITTVISEIESTIRKASAMPRVSDTPPAPLTMTMMPAKATRLASRVRGAAASLSQTQAMPAAAKGCTAMMIATLATRVSCRDGMKLTMPSVERQATSQPLAFIVTRPRAPLQPWVATRNSEMKPPPNRPRQNRMVHESKCRSRVKNGAVLQAIAAAMISATPVRCWRSVDGIGRRLVAQAEHALRLREAGNRKLAEVDPVIVAGAGKGGGRDHRAMQPAGDLLQPRGKIDRGPDAGEVEPAHATDIAEQNAADMQGDAEAKALDHIAARVMHGVDIGAGLAACRQHPAADLGKIAAVFRDREHREQPVAHEFQDLSAILADDRHLAIEILVEDVDHGFGRKAIGQRGEAAQIRQPDRGLHVLGVSSADLSCPNALAGAVADIGVEQHGS